ncbi:uncharacterized protein ARMOST_21479 [Armillaria ostoyae]|uniref:Uncharacterized protein n=1 Tax=Armillaria ostoyae TaxID=47428 RepID=A0A284SA64_ARMOS|nr:uncharacterized protein ARMOST_21479 [Armillaria ostoyae]
MQALSTVVEQRIVRIVYAGYDATRPDPDDDQLGILRIQYHHRNAVIFSGLIFSLTSVRMVFCSPTQEAALKAVLPVRMIRQSHLVLRLLIHQTQPDPHPVTPSTALLLAKQKTLY